MKEAREIVEGFPRETVLLLGDPILDIYVYGTAIGKSLETPTIVAKEESIKISFGGSSLVARNILELGAKVSYICVMGDDEGANYYTEFEHEDLAKHLIIDQTRRTTVKKRFWIDGYKLLQIDNLDNRDIDEKLEREVMRIFEDEISGCDVVVISDYRHGMMTKDLIKAVLEISREKTKRVFVDSQVNHRESVHHLYKDSYMALLSEAEAIAIDPYFRPSDADFENLKQKLGNSNICVKLGEKGSLCLFENRLVKTPAMKLDSVDTCGAGDAFLAALCISDFSEIEESLRIANTWAGLSTLIHGTTPPRKEDLLKFIENNR